MVNVKVINLIPGQVNEVVFPVYSGKVYIKNWSDEDVLFSFDSQWDETSKVRIKPKMSDFVTQNETNHGEAVAQQNKFYFKGSGEVEVQLKAWTLPDNYGEE